MIKKRVPLIIMVILITIPLVVSPAMAQTTRTDWVEQNNTCANYCPQGEDACNWIADGKILQVRGLVAIRHVERIDLNTNEIIPGWGGNVTVYDNYTINLETGDGSAWGTFVREYDEKEGTVIGSYGGPIRDGRFIGKFVAKGSGGEFEGQIIKGQVTKVPLDELPIQPPFCVSDDEFGEVNYGYTLDPGGK
jgi:hypothetical protein